MKISSKKPFYRRKKFIITLFAILAVAVSVGVFVYIGGSDKNNDPSSGKAKPEKRERKEQSKQESVSSENEQEKDAVRISDSTPSSSNVETPNITSAQLVGDYIRVSAIFSKPSSGKCILKFEQTGQTKLQKEAPIVVGPSYYVCNGFRVPASELPAKGKWNIIVIHELNGKTARSNKEINVQ